MITEWLTRPADFARLPLVCERLSNLCSTSRSFCSNDLLFRDLLNVFGASATQTKGYSTPSKRFKNWRVFFFALCRAFLTSESRHLWHFLPYVVTRAQDRYGSKFIPLTEAGMITPTNTKFEQNVIEAPPIAVVDALHSNSEFHNGLVRVIARSIVENTLTQRQLDLFMDALLGYHLRSRVPTEEDLWFGLDTLDKNALDNLAKGYLKDGVYQLPQEFAHDEVHALWHLFRMRGGRPFEQMKHALLDDALYAAVDSMDYDAAKQKLDEGADVNTDYWYNTPKPFALPSASKIIKTRWLLARAIDQSNSEMLLLLFSYGAKVHALLAKKMTALAFDDVNRGPENQLLSTDAIVAVLSAVVDYHVVWNWERSENVEDAVAARRVLTVLLERAIATERLRSSSRLLLPLLKLLNRANASS